MSAVAFIATPTEAHLYSDGCSTDKNGEIIRSGRNKVHAINDHTAAGHAGIWSDNGLEAVLERVRALEDPKEMADQAAELIDQFYSGVSRDVPDHPDGVMGTGFWIITYQEETPAIYDINTSEGPRPRRIPIDDVITMEMAYGNNEGRSVFEPWTKKYYQLYQDFGKAGKEAFRQMVSEFMDSGRINEEVYQQSIGLN